MMGKKSYKRISICNKTSSEGNMRCMTLIICSSLRLRNGHQVVLVLRAGGTVPISETKAGCKRFVTTKIVSLIGVMY